MVARHPLSDAEIDRVFRALADATRRDIVTRLLAGRPMSMSTLASRYDMSFAAVQKHIGVLEDAGLVTKHAQGRERIVHSNPETIARARELLTGFEEIWRARFDRLDQLLSEPETAADEQRRNAPTATAQQPDSPTTRGRTPPQPE